MRKHLRAAGRAALSLILMLALAAGCGQDQQDGQIILYDPADEQENITLSVFGYKADSLNQVAIEDTLHGYMEQEPGINVTYESIKGTAYWDALAKRAEAGVLDDIFMVNHETVMDYSAQGLLADLSGVPGLENYAMLARSQFVEEDGTVWFLPTCISAFGFYVNLDLLEEDGQPVPTNWEELAAVCDYYAGKGCAPIILNNYSSLRSLMIARAMYDVYQSADADAEIAAFNAGEKDLAEQLEPGIAMACEMAGRGWFDGAEALVTTQTKEDLELFVQGGRPFMVTGAWATPRVMDMDPGFEYAVYPFPILDDGSVLVVDVNTCMAVNATGAHQEEALDFLSYLIDPDVMWSYCDSQSSYTPLEDDRVPTDETIAPLAEYLSNGRSVFGSDYRLNQPVDTALVECSTAIFNGADADEAYTLLKKLLGR